MDIDILSRTAQAKLLFQIIDFSMIFIMSDDKIYIL